MPNPVHRDPALDPQGRGSPAAPAAPVPVLALAVVLTVAGTGWLVVLHELEGAVERTPLPLPLHLARDGVLALPAVVLVVVLAALALRRVPAGAGGLPRGTALATGTAAAAALAAGVPVHAALFEGPQAHQVHAAAALPLPVHLGRDLLLVLPVTLGAAQLVVLLGPRVRRPHPTAGRWSPLVRWGVPVGLAGLLSTMAYADVPEADRLRDRVTPCSDDSPVAPPFTARMTVPPLAPQLPSPDGSTQAYALTEERSQTEIIPGIPTPVWGYDGQVPGPTVLVRKDRPAQVTFSNQLPPGEDPSSIVLEQPQSEEHHYQPSSTVVHLHGVNGDHVVDGYPDDADGHEHLKGPGESRTHVYPNNAYQRAATYWYHDHSVHVTSNHVYRGLAGFYLVQDPQEEALNLPKGYGVHDVPLLLKDVMIEPRPPYRLVYDNCSHMGAYGDVMTVNGRQQPRFEVGTRKYRFRLLDGADARQFMPALRRVENLRRPVDDPGANEPFTLIGTDHGLLQHPEPVQSVHLSPSERLEVVVDFAKYPPGTRLVMVNLLADPSDRKLFPLMAFDVARAEADESVVPPVLRPTVEHPADEQPPARTRYFRFGRDGGTYWSINGKIFDPLRDDARPVVDTTEEWVLDNPAGGWGHPIHLHLGRFRITEIQGRAPRPGELQGWKDTVWLGPNQKIKVVHQFWNYQGRFVFHCHNGSHEDFDMMGQFNVQPAT